MRWLYIFVFGQDIENTTWQKKKKDMEAPVKIPVSIVKRMILVIRKCVFLKRGLRSNFNTVSVDELHFAR